MNTFESVVGGYIAQQAWDSATLSRLAFWVDAIGADTPFLAITEDQIDRCVRQLKARGRLHGGRNMPTSKTGKPLKPSTINRYIKQLQQVYTYARRQRIIPRTAATPVSKIELEAEDRFHDRYYTENEVDRLVATARITDRRWRKLPALIRLAADTGIRRGNLLSLRWGDVDLERHILSVPKTKNGDPLLTGLSTAAAGELSRLAGARLSEQLVFSNSQGRPYDSRRAWEKCQRACGLDDGRTFHSLRHGFGYRLAQSGASQSQVMALMGHKSLSASARYMHTAIGDKLQLIKAVCG